MQLLTLLISLIPTILTLVKTAQALPPDPVTGKITGEQKMTFVVQIVVSVLNEFPQAKVYAAPVIALVRPAVTLYVTLSNKFGWSDDVENIAASLANDADAVLAGLKAPVRDAVATAVR